MCFLKKRTYETTKNIISLLLLLLTLGFINAVPAQADSSTSQQVKAIQKRGVLNVGVKQDVPNLVTSTLIATYSV